MQGEGQRTSRELREAADDTLLELRNLKVSFPLREGTIRAVDGVSLEVRRGRTLGVIGESGSGKSVMAQAVLRLTPPPGVITDGEILLHGAAGLQQEIVDLVQVAPSGPEIRAVRWNDISMIFQEPMTSFSPVHTIGDQITEAILLHVEGTSQAEARRQAVALLTRVGIPNAENLVDTWPFQLSGGMRQRAMIGMALHSVSRETSAAPGIAFAGRTILRWGVALLGVRIGVDQLAALGLGRMAGVALAIPATIIVGAIGARLLGYDRRFGVLTGGATAICGASAALAIASVLPPSANGRRETLFAVVAVTSLSTVAMIFYPPLLQALGLAGLDAGFVIGATVHDVAQVVGAGYSISQEAGDASVVVKLSRVAMLLPVTVAIMMIFSERGKARESGILSLFPWFLSLFIALMALRSLGVLPEVVIETATFLSRFFLVCAIAAVGLQTSMGDVLTIGYKAVALVVIESIFLLLLVLMIVSV